MRYIALGAWQASASGVEHDRPRRTCIWTLIDVSTELLAVNHTIVYLSQMPLFVGGRPNIGPVWAPPPLNNTFYLNMETLMPERVILI